MNYLPYGVGNINTFNWNNLNVSGLNFYSGANISPGFNWSGYSGMEPGIVEGAAKGAAENGETNKSKLLAAILVFGPVLAEMAAKIILATKGVRVSNVNQFTDDQAKTILDYAGGNLNPQYLKEKYENEEKYRGAPLGLEINTSTIILAVGAVILYKLLTDK